jgi:putative DNA primase/helicase
MTTGEQVIANIKQARHQRQQQEAKAAPVAPPPVLPPPSAPMAVARHFVEACCMHDGKPTELTLHYWCGCWWAWRITHWIELAPHTVRSLLYGFTEYAVYADGEGELKPWQPNRYKIGDVLEALSAIVVLPGDLEQPTWLDGRATGIIVAVANGLLEVQTRTLLPHSPQFFNQTAVPFAYDKDAPEPLRFLEFLDALWPDDLTAHDVLAEWYGYVISGRLDLHKIFVMVGPTRGGKGVIARILTALIGKQNVCGPTLGSLGGEFGLAPLLGKSLAVISDARSGGGKNSSAVVERLLSISGEDVLTVNRKYREQWSGKLPVRLHVISNELPRLGDASSAIIGRLVLLLTTRSWLGKEDIELEKKLLLELSGILNFALDGLQRLTIDNENRFTRFEAADEAVTMMRDLASPVGAFVREKCKLGSDYAVGVDILYAAYKSWCQTGEYPKSPKVYFGRDLRAACPSVRRVRPRDQSQRLTGKSKRPYVYAGIALDEAEADEGVEADEGGPLGGYNPLFARTTRTAGTKNGSGPSGPSENPNVTPTEGPAPCHCGGAGAYGYKNPDGSLSWYCAAHRLSQYYADAHLGPDEGPVRGARKARPNTDDKDRVGRATSSDPIYRGPVIEIPEPSAPDVLDEHGEPLGPRDA